MVVGSDNATVPLLRITPTFFLVPNVPLYKSMVVGPDNATVPLLRITTTFSWSRMFTNINQWSWVPIMRPFRYYVLQPLFPVSMTYLLRFWGPLMRPLSQLYKSPIRCLRHQLNPFTILVSRGANQVYKLSITLSTYYNVI